MIVLNRKQSIQPFTSDLPAGSVLQQLQSVLAEPSGSTMTDDGIVSCSDHQHAVTQRRQMVLKALDKVACVEAAGTLLSIGFETIFEYLKVGDEGCH